MLFTCYRKFKLHKKNIKYIPNYLCDSVHSEDDDEEEVALIN